MQLALFGATGKAGGAVLQQARAAGYDVHALVRTPGKLQASGAAVTAMAGDVRDLGAVGRVVKNADAVVSAIGGTRAGNLAVLQQGTANILTAMQRHGVRRLIVIQGFHLPFTGDPRNLGRPVMKAMLWAWNRHLIADTYQMAEVVRGSALDWTLIRMPRLTTGVPSDLYRVGHLALGPWSSVTTGQVGHFALTCLEAAGFVRQAPMIARAVRAGHQTPGQAVAGRL
jgi:putative NADH-flavin reductase